MIQSLARRCRSGIQSWLTRPELEISADPTDTESVTVRYLMYVLLPAWIVPGVADYLMHRRTRIQDTSGAGESVIHSLMMAEIGLPVTLALLCEINPLLLSVALLTTCAHEATAIWDVRAAVDGGREVRPAEQHIHSFLESMPFMAVSALLCLHWDQVVRALRTGWSDRGAWRLRPRSRRLPGGYLAGVLAGVIILIALPYGEELLRCATASRRRPRRWHPVKRDCG